MKPTRRLVHRPRLEDVRDEVLTRRLTTVTAGAGFGKTTLVRAWTAETPTAAHAVTPQDRAVTTFAEAIVAAVTAVVEDLPRDLPAALASGTRPADGAAARAFAAALCDAVRERLTGEAVLVLDDVHHVGPSGPAADLLAALCHHTAPPLHVVLTTREQLSFGLERFRGRGDLVELGAADLAFTPDETAQLLALAVDPDSAGLARPLHAATGGWPAALVLAAEVLKTLPADERSQRIDRLGAAGSRVAEYLLHEVVDREPLAVRELLRTVATLPRFTAGLCEALGQQHAAGTITSLVRRGLLIEPEPAAPGWHRLTGLTRQFLVEHLPLHDWERADVNLRAASWFAEHARVEEALGCLVASGDQTATAAFLHSAGEELLRSGATDAVLAALEGVPDRLRDATLETLHGEALHVRGDWDAALERLHRAAPPGELLPAGLAWRIGVIHHLRGGLDAALAVYARGQPEPHPTKDAAMLLAWHAAAQWLRGDMVACARLTDQAREVATATGDDQALAAAHIAQALVAAAAGDRAGNHAHYARALEHARQAGDVLQMIRVHTNSASRHLEEARYPDALAEADRALALTEVAGFAAFHILALSNRGETLIRLGRLDEAVVDLQAARGLAQRTGSGMVTYPLVRLGDVYRIRGDRAQARGAYEEARARARAVDDVQGLVPALTGLARMLADDGTETAVELAREAVSAAVGLSEVGARLAAGRVALARGDDDEARLHAGSAADAARGRRDRAGLAESLQLAGEVELDAERAVVLLEESVALWRDVGDPLGEMAARLALARRAGPERAHALVATVEDRARELGARPLAAAAAAVRERRRAVAPVAVRTLGGFAVLRDGEPVARSAWQSRKARDLLKMMVARRGRMTARDVHMEDLWPDADPSALSNRFSVALTTVRSVLDPDRRFDADHFVVADDDAVGLDVTHLDVDVERFLGDADAGLALWRSGRTAEALERLAAAESAYHGDFLEEEPYEEWSIPLREEARARYLAVVHTLADAAADDGDAEAAVRYLLRALERDPYDEGAHLSLVVSQQAAGQHGEASRSYRSYVARMEEIQVEAAPMPAGATSSQEDHREHRL